MAINKKGKRKLVFQDREFYWYMKLTDDWMYAYNSPQLHIVSDDKKFIVSYQARQKNDNPFLIIKGKDFVGINHDGTWQRVKIPDWEDDQITPGFVKNLIEWSFDKNQKRILVNYLGKIVE